MAKPIPFPTKPKEAPEEAPDIPAVPEETEIKEADLEASPEVETVPEESPLKEETPEASPPKEEFPSDLNEENTVKIGDKYIEIKPTKVKYFRNKTTTSYGYLKAIPLNEFLSYGKGVLDKTKDADQLLYDFLVAVFDDSSFVRDNYDEMTADDIERIIKIFGRINHIDEKEEAARKNKEAQAKH